MNSEILHIVLPVKSLLDGHLLYILFQKINYEDFIFNRKSSFIIQS
jgi:hypothetical protein